MPGSELWVGPGDPGRPVKHRRRRSAPQPLNGRRERNPGPEERTEPRFPRVPPPGEAATGRGFSRSAPPGSGLEAGESPRSRPLLRALALLLAILEVGLLAYAVAGPWFAVRSVSVSGLHHLDRVTVVAAAGLQRPGSLLVVDGDSIRRKLARLPWVRTSSAQPVLPDRVLITIEEWKPVGVYQAGPAGRPVYLNELGTVLAPGSPDPQLVGLVGPAAADPRPGDHPVEPQLLHALMQIQAALPALFGQAVAGFQLDCLGNLTLTTSRNVRLIFGRVLTPEEFASLKDKLSALRSIANEPGVGGAEVEYINLENPLAPAVKIRGATPPPSPSPLPGASPRPSPTPLPSPKITAAPCR